MKMNKKGFTLIEMLVVIAIIAILVAIVIPVVGSSTSKAQAATDAANLRSAQAALQIAVLNGGVEADDAGTADEYEDLTGSKAPVCKTDKTWEFKYTITETGTVTVMFNDQTIADFAATAGDEATDADEEEEEEEEENVENP